mgnify:CR=1 FL=1
MLRKQPQKNQTLKNFLREFIFRKHLIWSKIRRFYKLRIKITSMFSLRKLYKTLETDRYTLSLKRTSRVITMCLAKTMNSLLPRESNKKFSHKRSRVRETISSVLSLKKCCSTVKFRLWPISRTLLSVFYTNKLRLRTSFRQCLPRLLNIKSGRPWTQSFRAWRSWKALSN